MLMEWVWSAGREIGQVVDVHMAGTSDAFSKARTVVMADILSFGHDKVMGGKCACLSALDTFTHQQLAVWTWR